MSSGVDRLKETSRAVGSGARRSITAEAGEFRAILPDWAPIRELRPGQVAVGRICVSAHGKQDENLFLAAAGLGR
jgi:hypothetical protein